MKRITLTLLVFAALSARGQHAAGSGKSRPNIVYIMSDDHGYQAVSAYGYGLNKTPNIDRLAKEGALFTRATVTNSLCALPGGNAYRQA